MTRHLPDLKVAIFDKEPYVAAHQSGHNSGVIHSGIYYKPGSLKAKLCIAGSRSIVRFCNEHQVPFEICGKLIVATRNEELPRLEELYLRGEQNGLRGLQRLTAEEVTRYEPYAIGIKGILVPGTGIVDYAKVTAKYAELITANGGLIHLSTKIIAINGLQGSVGLETNQGSFKASVVINCAGLQSDRVSRMADARPDMMIVPFRGEYYDLAPAKQHNLRGLLYPVPNPQFPFLGVHFTRRIGGGIEAGPNAVLALKREGYLKTSFRLGDVLEYASFPGFWTMARRHWRTSLGEYHRSWSKAAFVRDLRQLMPELRSEDLIPGGAGVRAQALDRNGDLIDDFRFVHTEGMVHVCNAPSPAATASLAIGRHIVATVLEYNSHRLRKTTPHHG